LYTSSLFALIIFEAIYKIVSMSKKTALVTGATSGFGEAIARILAKSGHSLIITGRREDRLLKLKTELEKEHPTQVRSLCFDVRQREQVIAAAKSIEDIGIQVDFLINNAGLALGVSGVENGDVDDWDQMLDTNVKGLLYVTKYFLPIMPNGSHIVNIGSIAGKEVYPGGNVYCASKHAVDALNRAMRIDLLERHIKVSQVAPGLAETEFSIVRFKGDSEKAAQVYKGLVPLCAQDIAEAVEFILSRPPHVCINDLVIMASAQGSATLVRRDANS
jgi:NADP-dependent 3-hydroxy acid dehydrogenase YdfG